MSPEECRAARVALGWSLTRLASEANVIRSSAANFEDGFSVSQQDIEAMGRALVNARASGTRRAVSGSLSALGAALSPA